MPPLSIMIKPASSLCNLRCKYCFYHDISSQREEPGRGIMKTETAEMLVKDALGFAGGNSVSFAFQGGEPLLAGIEFFQSFIKQIKKYNSRKSPVQLSIQTNGTLLNESWAPFLKKNKFLVGLSLDGDKEINSNRIGKNEESAFGSIMNAAALLEKTGVDFNILSVVTGKGSESIEQTYEFFKSKGFKYLQFIPCLRPLGEKGESELWMTEKQYENYLKTLFCRYAADYAKGEYISIRYFDNLVRLFLGRPAEQCGMMGHCTYQLVIEADGSVYPCDFYCLDEWKLGGIGRQTLKEMTESERATAFIKESLVVYPKCKGCRFYALCRGGGCKRSRTDRDYCKAYESFFTECLPLFRVFKG